MVACVAFLWANRLLPVELAQRGGWEVRVFFLVWLLSLGHAIVRPWRSAWREQLALAAALCIGLPALNLLGDSRGDYFYLELTTVALGLMLAWPCWKLCQAPKERAPRRVGKQPVAEAN